MRFRVLLLGFVMLSAAAFGDEARVAALIAGPSGGGGAPLLWFRKDPQTNSAPGGAALTVRRPDDLSARAPDPWGNPDSAFGPSAENPVGAAIAGSRSSDALCSDEGTVVMFLKAPEERLGNAIILTRGGYQFAFDLRICGAMLTAIGVTGDPSSAPKNFKFSAVGPGNWHLIALRWKKKGEDYALSWSLGQLADGAACEEGEITLRAVGCQSKELELAGRIVKPESSALELKGGFLNNFAVYDTRLSDAALAAIYAAAKQGLK